MQVTIFAFQHRLEDLFLIEEDVKREDEKEDEKEESADSLAAKQSLITHPQVRSPNFFEGHLSQSATHSQLIHYHY